MKTAKILVGQPGHSQKASLQALVSSREWEVRTASSGEELLSYTRSGFLPDVVVLDGLLVSPGAAEICRYFRSDSKYSLVHLVVTAPEDLAVEKILIDTGCDDVFPADISSTILAARIRSMLRIRALISELDDAGNVLLTLAKTIEAKDQSTQGHADRVARYAVNLGKKLGLSGTDIDTLRKGGLLHDVGKISIPDAILLKPGRYTPEEFAIMKRHPAAGCDICASLRTVQDALPLIKHHHERLDGSGYPDGLKGEAIPSLVRIITIVDIYDALRSQRSYKEAFSVDKSFQILWEEADKGWWDKSILTAWEHLIRAGRSDSLSVS